MVKRYILSLLLTTLLLTVIPSFSAVNHSNSSSIVKENKKVSVENYGSEKKTEKKEVKEEKKA
jgi:hypothetical protein